VIGSTKTCSTVDPASRNPNIEPACTDTPNMDTAQSRSAL